MVPRYSTVAVIGAGPAGISALRALYDEQSFETIRVFERRDTPGGTWNYDPIPQPFPGTYSSSFDADLFLARTPTTFPWLTTPPIPEDVSIRTAIYSWLDTNVPADLMAFSHTPLPEANSFISMERYGVGNPTRPHHVVARYLKSLANAYHSAISFNTTVETVEKTYGGKWRLTLRRREVYADTPQDSWWQEEFDAVIIATGQYNVPFIPEIDGLDEVVKTHPKVLEHSNAFRSPEPYVGKRVVVVGGSFSAGDVVGDIHGVVRPPLFVSQRTPNPAVTGIWSLPYLEIKPTITRIEGQSPFEVTVTFSDGSVLENVEKIIFATGFWLSYPFLSPNPVTNTNRMAGFYQHVFKIGDPSLAVVGLARGPLSFRFMEYESVALARYYAGRGAELPSRQDQEEWELRRLEEKGDGPDFHNIPEEMKEHMVFLRELAGPPAPGTTGYDLPKWSDEWLERGFRVLKLKDQYWKQKARRSTLKANI